MADIPQTPEAVALALTQRIADYEIASADYSPDRKYILSLYDECLKVVKEKSCNDTEKEKSRNKTDAKREYGEALEEMY
jgi:hypothetical protein